MMRNKAVALLVCGSLFASACFGGDDDSSDGEPDTTESDEGTEESGGVDEDQSLDTEQEPAEPDGSSAESVGAAGSTGVEAIPGVTLGVEDVEYRWVGDPNHPLAVTDVTKSIEFSWPEESETQSTVSTGLQSVLLDVGPEAKQVFFGVESVNSRKIGSIVVWSEIGESTLIDADSDGIIDVVLIRTPAPEPGRPFRTVDIALISSSGVSIAQDYIEVGPLALCRLENLPELDLRTSEAILTDVPCDELFGDSQVDGLRRVPAAGRHEVPLLGFRAVDIEESLSISVASGRAAPQQACQQPPCDCPYVENLRSMLADQIAATDAEISAAEDLKLISEELSILTSRVEAIAEEQLAKDLEDTPDKLAKALAASLALEYGPSMARLEAWFIDSVVDKLINNPKTEGIVTEKVRLWAARRGIDLKDPTNLQRWFRTQGIKSQVPGLFRGVLGVLAAAEIAEFMAELIGELAADAEASKQAAEERRDALVKDLTDTYGAVGAELCDPDDPGDDDEYECLLSDDCRQDDKASGNAGHPNVYTWDGVTLAFHGAGDYLMVADGDEWAIQVRYSRIENMRRVSYVRALAVRVGEQIVTVGDSPDKGPWDTAELRVDGEVVQLSDGELFDLESGGVFYDGDRWLIMDDRGRAAIAGDQIGDPHEFRLPSWELWDEVVGMAGSPDDDPTNDVRAADGTPIDPAVFDELYNVFGASWLVPPEQSLFETPLDPVDEDPIFPEANLLLSDFDEEIRRQAEAICREAGNEPGSGLNECMFDLVLTGDARWAEAMGPIAQLTRQGVHWRLIDPRIDDDQEIELGQMVEDALQTTGAHRYRFTAEAGDRVVLRLTEPCGDATPTTLVAGFVGRDGLVTESISLTDCGDSKPLLVEEAGEFALLVTDEQGLSSSFAFELVAATDQDKGEIEVGETVSDEFFARSDVHAWTIDVGDADAISVNGLDVPCDATWLLERDGEPIWSDDGCVTSPPIPTGGELRLLLIADFGGPYEFELFDVPEPQEFELPDDGAVTGEIAEPGASAVYFVEIEEGQLIQVFSDTESCDLGRLLLDAPSGDAFRGRDLCRDSGPYDLPEAGRWGIRVDPPGDATGEYAFRVAVVEDTRSGGEAAIGELIEGTINAPGESVSFDLDAVPGDRFQVVAGDTECGLSELILEGTDGSLYYFDDVCEDHVIRVNDTGVVRLIIDPDADQTGPFSFRLVPVVTMTGEFAFEEVLQGSIDTVGGRYVFPLTVPESGIAMQIVETGTPCGFSQLYWAPPGATRFQYVAEVCEDHVISIDEGGEYELIVDPGGLQTGRFSFRAFEIVTPDPVPLRLGSEVRGSLTTPGEYAVYTFTTTVDDAEFEFVSGTDDCDFSQAFYRPADGRRLRYWGNLCEDHAIRVDEAGEWAIVIDPGDSRTGDFAFTLRRA